VSIDQLWTANIVDAVDNVDKASLFTRLKGRRSQKTTGQYHDSCQTLMSMQLCLYTSFARCYLLS
jgi:hypothetical protein